MNRPSNRLACVVVALLVTSCAGQEVRDANLQLTSAFEAKDAAIAAKNPVGMLNAQAALARLAVDSAAQAAGDSNNLNKIALYRISAVAAFGAADSKLTIDAADKGKAACTKEGESAPTRDCELLKLVEALRSNNEQTEHLKRLVSAGDTPVSAADLDDIFNNYGSGFNTIIAMRTDWAQRDMPGGFLAGVDANLDHLVCKQLQEEMQFRYGNLKDLDLLDARTQSITKMRCKMRGAGVKVSKEGICYKGCP